MIPILPMISRLSSLPYHHFSCPGVKYCFENVPVARDHAVLRCLLFTAESLELFATHSSQSILHIRKSFLDMCNSHLHFSLMMDLVLLMAVSFLFSESALFVSRRDTHFIVESPFHYGESVTVTCSSTAARLSTSAVLTYLVLRVAVFYVRFGVVVLALSGAMSFCHVSFVECLIARAFALIGSSGFISVSCNFSPAYALILYRSEVFVLELLWLEGCSLVPFARSCPAV